MELKKSLYDKALELNEQRLNTGLDYKANGLILRSTLSPYMYLNSNLSSFMDDINDVCVQNIENIKRIRIHNNFTVGKDTTYIN